ncbi:MAG: putative toxin-antitoxin system toxin component, PIN family [Caldilineae bacterium]|nr:MAG: putative toxin-antitoxin system toxin component, PIN family [Caldilineae bacterium]
MKVVLDTNVLVSSVLGGQAAQVLELWREERFDLLVTSDILQEYWAVLTRPKFGLSQDVIDDLAGYIFRRSVFVAPAVISPVVFADPDDDKFLAAAIGGGADVIVSGDKHLLAIERFEGIPILTIRDFLAFFV